VLALTALPESLANCLRFAQLADEHSLMVTKSLYLSVSNDEKAIVMLVSTLLATSHEQV
jgi:hypothetical protein